MEYSEIPRALAELRDIDGRLVYSAGNIAQHYFSVEFLARVATSPLPFHPARKAVQCVSAEGVVATPATPNAVKLEMFIFDAFVYSQGMRALAVEREEEFSGVKNKAGGDSPETAREAVSRLHRRWVEAAGGKVEGEGLVEVSGTVSYAGEGLEERVKGKVFTPPVLIT